MKFFVVKIEKFILAAYILLALFGCDKKKSPQLPNILICIADDAGHMGKNYPWVNTPTFDRVASEGIFFQCLYTQC